MYWKRHTPIEIYVICVLNKAYTTRGIRYICLHILNKTYTTRGICYMCLYILNKTYTTLDIRYMCLHILNKTYTTRGIRNMCLHIQNKTYTFHRYWNVVVCRFELCPAPRLVLLFGLYYVRWSRDIGCSFVLRHVGQ